MYEVPELEGFWWTPDASETHLHGRLVTKNDRPRLVLTENAQSPKVFSREIKKYEVFHGRATNGHFISLLRCIEVDSGRSSSGIEQRVVLADYILIGGLVPPDLLDSAFAKMTLKWPALKHWFDKSGVAFDFTGTDSRSFQISFEPQKPIAIQYADDIRIEIDFSPDKAPIDDGLFLEGVSFAEIICKWLGVTSCI